MRLANQLPSIKGASLSIALAGDVGLLLEKSPCHESMIGQIWNIGMPALGGGSSLELEPRNAKAVAGS